MSGRDRKPPSLYDPYLEGKQYGDQLFGMNMEYKMTTTNNLNSVAMHAIFAQVLKSDLMQEAPRVHNKMFFERVYNIFGERAISVLFKEYKYMEYM